LNVLLEWDRKLNPVLIWIGYDSKRCGLLEPSPERVRELYWKLGKA
jgi:hypothetical protein